jgi:hypothetical protein
MADIFVSYAREDLNFAKKLAKALETQGWSVWWDRRIAAGDRFTEVISRELKDGRCSVTVWSRQSVGSRWVHDEAEYALEQKKLVPVLADDVDIPLGFRGVHAADLRGWRGSSQHPGFQRLVRDISERLGAPQPVEPDKPKPPASDWLRPSDWLRRAASWLREAAPMVVARVLPIIQGIATRTRVSGSTKRKMAIVAGVGVLVVLLAVIFYGSLSDHRPMLPIRQDTNIQGIVAQITKCNRSKNVLTIDIQFVNTKEQAYKITFVGGGNYNQYNVIANGKRYFILLDADKVPMATPLNYTYSTCIASSANECKDLRVEIERGGSYTFWAMYPAPPAEVRSISFYTPFTRPFDDVPITDSR